MAQELAESSAKSEPPGKGVWWKETEDGYLFSDAVEDPISHPEGPHLRHYCSTSMTDVCKSSKPLHCNTHTTTTMVNPHQWEFMAMIYSSMQETKEVDKCLSDECDTHDDEQLTIVEQVGWWHGHWTSVISRNKTCQWDCKSARYNWRAQEIRQSKTPPKENYKWG